MDNIKNFEDFLDRMQGLLDNAKKQGHIIVRIEDLENAFPELKESKESEDKNIRKDIVAAVETYGDFTQGRKEEIYTWLEKQDKHTTDKVEPKFKVGDVVINKKSKDTVKIVQILHDSYCYSGWDGAATVHSDFSISEQDNWEVVEQKPADKVEPKFHEGDWITFTRKDSTREVLQVSDIIDDRYYFNHLLQFSWSIKECDEVCHLWTIQDAKDGDVLMSESNCGLGTWYCIFKSLDDDESMTVYCYLARDGRFETKKELCFDKDPFNTKPATKKQRDFLFQKMKEAGYEWDAEKKELKKIEQNPVEWSEEDERMYRGLHNLIYSTPYCDSRKELSDWLKFLKDSVQSKQKQEWDKEDEKCIKLSTDIIDSALRAGFCVQLDRDRCVDWLKSLRPQNTWKPTKEQIRRLEYFVKLWGKTEDTENTKVLETVKSLLNDLKQL